MSWLYYDIVTHNENLLFCPSCFDSSLVVASYNKDDQTEIGYGITYNNDYPSYYDITTDSQGRIYILACPLTTTWEVYYNGIQSPAVIRLLQDGTIDSSYNIGNGPTDYVTTLMIDSSDKLLVGGHFLNWDGYGRNAIVRLNENGSVDTTFTSPFLYNNHPTKIIQQTDGKYVITSYLKLYYGNFSDPTMRSGVVRLNNNGTLDNTWTRYNENGGNDMLQDLSGKILIAKDFSTGLVRYNTNGIKDNTFNIGTGFTVEAGFGYYPFVNCITLQDTDIYAGGCFQWYRDISANTIVKINNDGTIDTGFITSTQGGYPGNWYLPRELKVINNKLYVFGGSISYDGSVCPGGIFVLNDNGSKNNDADFGHGFDIILNSDYMTQHARVFSATQYENNLYLIGDFNRYKYSPTDINHFAVIDTSGTNYTIPEHIPGPIYDIVVDSSNLKTQLPLLFNDHRSRGYVEWGDESSEYVLTIPSQKIEHTYSNTGTYTIKMYGDFRAFYWDDVSSYVRDQLVRIRSFGTYYAGYSDYDYVETKMINLYNLTTIDDVSIANNDFRYFHYIDFANAYKLTSIPETLFRHSTTKYFLSTFENCYALQSIPLNLFYHVNDPSGILSFQKCFKNCTGLTGNAPDIWNTIPGAVGTQCFYNCTGLSNYASIPIDWK